MNAEQQRREMDAAILRCSELNRQEYWETKINECSPYNEVALVTLFRVKNLTPAWWATLCGDGALRDPTISISGHVERLSIPILPTLIRTKEPDPRGRGTFELMPVLKVKRLTKKAAGKVPSYYVKEDNMVVPFTISAAPVLSFHEELNYFASWTPSNAERYNTGVKLVLDYVVAAQQKLWPDCPGTEEVKE